MFTVNRTDKDSRRQSGATLIEFALILPILLFLLFGIFEFGRIFNTYLIVVNGAREGARHGALGSNQAEIIQKSTEACPNLDPGLMSFVVSGAEGNSGQQVRVRVIYSVDILTPIFEPMFPADPFPVSSEAVMMIE